MKIMPEILALGSGGTLDGVGATLMKFLADRGGVASPTAELPAAKDAPQP